jgi:hypothetical protein
MLSVFGGFATENFQAAPQQILVAYQAQITLVA